MAQLRVVDMGNNPVAIIVPAMKAKRPGEDDATFYARVFDETIARNPALQGRPYVDIHDEDVTQFGRKDRHRLRIKNGKVVVDNTIPRKTPTRQDLLADEVDAANSIADLKKVMKRILGQ